MTNDYVGSHNCTAEYSGWPGRVQLLDQFKVARCHCTAVWQWLTRAPSMYSQMTVADLAIVTVPLYESGNFVAVTVPLYDSQVSTEAITEQLYHRTAIHQHLFL